MPLAPYAKLRKPAFSGLRTSLPGKRRMGIPAGSADPNPMIVSVGKSEANWLSRTPFWKTVVLGLPSQEKKGKQVKPLSPDQKNPFKATSALASLASVPSVVRCQTEETNDPSIDLMIVVGSPKTRSSMYGRSRSMV